MGWFSNVVHGVLDVAGMIPGVGAVADGLNAVIYAAEGDYANAAMSAIAMVPGIGDSIALASKGAKVAKGLKGLSKLGKGKALLKGLKKKGAKALDSVKGFMKEGGSFLKKGGKKKAHKQIKTKQKKACTNGRCFTGDTLVYTEAGYRPICEIEAGDLIYSMNEKTGEIGLKKVEKRSCTEAHTIYEIETEGNTKIKATAYHSLYVSDKGWVTAINLNVGDLLLSVDGSVEITAITKTRKEEPVKTYNFNVEDWLSYFVTERNLYVHNGDPHALSKKNGTYEAASYHGTKSNAVKNKAPIDGQAALDNSVPIKPDTTTRRVGTSEGELVVLDETTTGVFHGHVRSWNEMSQQMKNALIKSGKVNKKGKVL